jgi:hypothetical protein
MSKKLSTLNMKKIIITIFILFTSVIHAQSNLPACNGDYSGPCFGTRTYSQGDIYTGEFRNDKRNGQGINTWTQGFKYVGGWKDGWQSGQGTMTWPDGSKYVGQYIDGKMNGQGAMYNADGSVRQQGIWRDDIFIQAQAAPAPIVPEVVSGYPACTGSNWDRCYGEFTYNDGTRYQGQWLNSKRNGQGTYYFVNGDKYIGQWVIGIMEGQASYIWRDGSKYIGQYKNDKRNGYGTYYNANGSINQQGMWKDGEIVKVQTTPPVIAPVVPKPPVPINNPQDIKRQKCIRLGLAPGSADFQQCIN